MDQWQIFYGETERKMIQYNNHNDLCTPVKKHRKKKKILKFYNIKKYQISEQAIEFFFIMRGLNAKE